MTKEKVITQSTLISWGWTQTMIKNLLSEPELVPNPHYKNAAPMKLYYETEVLAVMDSKKYLEEYEKAKKRKEAAKRAKETKTDLLNQRINQYAESINVTIIDDRSLIEQTIEAKQKWHEYCGKYYSDLRYECITPDTLNRWVVNYIRHNLVRYDEGLYSMRGKIGKDSAYYNFKKAILEKISEAYPKYAEECRNQIDNFSYMLNAI